MEKKIASELLKVARMLMAEEPEDAAEEPVADQKGQGGATFWDVGALKDTGFKLTTRLGEIDSQDKLAELMKCVKRSTTVNKSFRDFKNGK